jgi:CHAT domain-containing protein
MTTMTATATSTIRSMTMTEPRPRHIRAALRRLSACGASATLAALLLAGCAATPVGDDGTAVDLDVGTNQSGEPCTLSGRPAPAKIAEAGARYYSLQCGRWEQPSGSLFVAGVGAGSAESLARDGWWRTRLEQFLDCDVPTGTSVLDGVAAIAMDCRLQKGGWAFQALAVQIGDKVYLADSIPSAFGPMEQAIGALSGRRAADALGGDESEEMRRLQGRLAGADFDIRDITQYNDLRRLARYHNRRGEYALAEQQYRRALTVAEQERAEQVAFLAMHIALELSNQRKFDAAEAMFERADAALPGSGNVGVDRARLAGYRAMHLANQRRNAEAAALAGEATRLFQAQGYAGDTGAFDLTAGHEFTATSGLLTATTGADLLASEGASAWANAVKSSMVETRTLLNQGRVDAAETELTQARKLYAQNPQAPRTWSVQLDVLGAEIAERRGQLGKAERLLKSAVATDAGLVGSSRSGGLAWLALGRINARQGKEGQALNAFREGFAVFAEQGGSVDVDAAMPYFRIGAKRGGKALAAELFEAAQLVTSATVTRQIAEVTARLESGDQAVSGLIRDIQDAQRERERVREQIDVAGAASAPATEALRRRYEEINAALQGLELEVQSASPQYNQLVLFEAIPVGRVQQGLRAGEGLSQLLIGADGGVGFLVTRDDIRIYPVELTSAEARRIVAALRAPVEDPLDIPPYPVDAAYRLYQTLYGPVTAELSALRHLVTIPSGDLLSLPFAMLVVEPPPPVSGFDYSGVTFMVARHALTLAPAVQSFASLRDAKPSQARYPFLGFGDPLPGGNTSAVLAGAGMTRSAQCAQEAGLIANFAPLPDTAFEIRESAKALGAGPGSVVLGRAFTERAVKQRPLDRYRIVSFATHGLLPSKLACLNDAALVTTPGSGAYADGLLEASEVAAELKMDADLVVLSACDTGGGGESGEALSGLARTFFFAGARNLLVSHWEVPSLTTTELLVQSFRKLSTPGMTSAEALRQSQLGIIATGAYSHPKAWAGFTVVGHGG